MAAFSQTLPPSCVDETHPNCGDQPEQFSSRHMMMNWTRNASVAPSLGSRPNQPNTVPARPTLERSTSNLPASGRQQKIPNNSPSLDPSGAQASYFPSDIEEDKEDFGPLELTENSVGATIRLIHRYQELIEIAGMWTDYRLGVGKSDEADWLGAYYTNEISRSFNFMRRAHCEVQQLRNVGYGTEHPTFIEKELAQLLDRVQEWRNKNIKTQAQPDRAARRFGGSGEAQSYPQNPTEHRRNAEPSPHPNRGPSDGTMALFKLNPPESSKSSSSTTSKAPSPSPNRDEAPRRFAAPIAPREPTREETMAQMTKMLDFMDCVAASVEACKLTRDQMETAVRLMRKELLEVQKDILREMIEENKLEKSGKRDDGMQLVRRS